MLNEQDDDDDSDYVPGDNDDNSFNEQVDDDDGDNSDYVPGDDDGNSDPDDNFGDQASIGVRHIPTMSTEPQECWAPGRLKTQAS